MNETNIVLKQVPTELYKILKFEGIAASGAEAKLMIDNQEVFVNNELETRRRRKIQPGDVITIFDNKLIIQEEP